MYVSYIRCIYIGCQIYDTYISYMIHIYMYVSVHDTYIYIHIYTYIYIFSCQTVHIGRQTRNI